MQTNRRALTAPTRRIATAALVAAITVPSLSACSAPEDELLGEWVGACGGSPGMRAGGQPFSFEFAPDGKVIERDRQPYSTSERTGRYIVEGDQLNLIDEQHSLSAHYALTDDGALNLDAVSDSARPTTPPVWCTLTRGHL